MIEILAIINPPSSHSAEEYKNKAMVHFKKFGLDFKSESVKRKQYEIIIFYENEEEVASVLEIMGDSFLISHGTWFYRNMNIRESSDRSYLFGLLCKNNNEIENVEGNFNFLFYDSHIDKLKIFTDRLNHLPLFARTIQSTEYISTNCLMLASLENCRLSNIGLMEFLLANKLFKENTLFKGIKKLQNAFVIEFSRRGRNAKPYWALNTGRDKHRLTVNEKIELFGSELKLAAKKIATKFNRPFIDLTGGWDSRSLIIAFSDHVDSLAAVTSGREKDSDVIIARKIAQTMGVQHYLNETTDEFTHEEYKRLLTKAIFLTDGQMPAPLYVNTLRNQSKSMENGAAISVNGSGGELFRAYWWEPAHIYNSNPSTKKITFPALTQYYNKNELIRRVIHQESDIGLFDPGFDTNIYEHLARSFDITNRPHMPMTNIDQIANIYVTHRMMNWLSGYISATSRYLKCISPILTTPLLELAFQLKPSEKIFSRFLRRYIKRFNPEIAAIELGYGYPAEPLGIGNMFRFLPAVKQNINNSISKLSEKGFNKTNKQAPNRMKSAVNIVENLKLDPNHMQLTGIFNINKLEKFIEDYKWSNFPYNQLYENIFTVESVLRYV